MNEAVKKINPKPARKESEPRIPIDLHKALATAPRVKTIWNSLTPIARRDFVSWIDSAKQPKTHRRRIKKACSMLTAGKRRPCCYTLVPMNLYKALSTNPRAKAQWRDLTPNGRRDFISWIDSTKQSEIRMSRIQKTCTMLATGKEHP